MSRQPLISTYIENYPRLARALNLEKILIKREDLNPSGSHKDRAIWPMLEHYLKEGIKDFVISSSGNAAISAAFYAKHNKNLNLHVFISPKIPKTKRQRLDKNSAKNVSIYESYRAKSKAIKFVRESNFQLIRTSTDNTALSGYQQLAHELTSQLADEQQRIENFDLFVPVSSGTTLQGLHEGFKLSNPNNMHANGSLMPKLHIVQTCKVAVMAKEFDNDYISAQTSLASAIVDTIAHRKEKVLEAVKNSDGSGWVISDEELRQARQSLTSNTDLKNVNWDALLALAGLIKACQKGQSVKKAILLFTGK